MNPMHTSFDEYQVGVHNLQRENDHISFLFVATNLVASDNIYYLPFLWSAIRAQCGPLGPQARASQAADTGLARMDSPLEAQENSASRIHFLLPLSIWSPHLQESNGVSSPSWASDLTSASVQALMMTSAYG